MLADLNMKIPVKNDKGEQVEQQRQKGGRRYCRQGCCLDVRCWAAVSALRGDLPAQSWRAAAAPRAQGVMLAMLFELQALEMESEPWLAMTSGSV